MRFGTGLALTVGLAASLACADDLVVDSGVFVINPGDVYDNVTVIEPGEVVMNGGEILGALEVSGTFTLNDGRIAGRVGAYYDGGPNCAWSECGTLIVNGGEVTEGGTLGRFEIHGGFIESAGTVGSIEMTGGEAGFLTANRYGDSAGGGSISVTGGVVRRISGTTDKYGNLVGGAHVTNAVVLESMVGTAGAGAAVGGDISNGRVLPGAVVAGNGSKIIMSGGRLGGSLADSVLSAGAVGGSATNVTMSGGSVGGAFVALDSCVFNPPYSEPMAALSGGFVVGGITTQSFANPLDVSNTKIGGTIFVETESSVRFEAYALSINGEPVDLSSPAIYTNSTDDEIVLENVVMISADGRRSEFTIRLQPFMYDVWPRVRFTGVPLDTGCAPADLAAPFGMLDLADILAFVTLFEFGDPAADLAEPFGTLDLQDVAAFAAGFGDGCP